MKCHYIISDHKYEHTWLKLNNAKCWECDNVKLLLLKVDIQIIKSTNIQEIAFKMVYNEKTSTFESLLENDKSVTIHHRTIHVLAAEMYKAKKQLITSNNKKHFSN